MLPHGGDWWTPTGSQMLGNRLLELLALWLAFDLHRANSEVKVYWEPRVSVASVGLGGMLQQSRPLKFSVPAEYLDPLVHVLVWRPCYFRSLGPHSTSLFDVSAQQFPWLKKARKYLRHSC